MTFAFATVSLKDVDSVRRLQPLAKGRTEHLVLTERISLKGRSTYPGLTYRQKHTYAIFINH